MKMYFHTILQNFNVIVRDICMYLNMDLIYLFF